MTAPAFYIASSLANAVNVRALRDRLVVMGLRHTYDWTEHGSVQADGEERIREVALLEFNGVQAADLVIVLLPGGRGTHVELGLALGMQKHVLLVATHEQLHADHGVCAFYLHPQVARVDTARDAVELLKTWPTWPPRWTRQELAQYRQPAEFWNASLKAPEGGVAKHGQFRIPVSKLKP